MGDLNGRTKLGEDFVIDSEDEHSPINIPPSYEKDTFMSRVNSDSHQIDQQGRKILDFCKTSHFRILNGRTRGDSEGKFTRFPRKYSENPSVIDYALCNTYLLPEIHSFMVLPYTGLSDHCCISVNLNINVHLTTKDYSSDGEGEVPIYTPKVKFVFDKNRAHLYEQNLSNDVNVDYLLASLNQNEVSRENICKKVEDLNDILISAAQKTFLTIKLPLRKKKNKIKLKSKGWFTRECANRRNIFRKYSKILAEKPFDRKNLHSFIQARAAYKKACRNAEKSYRNTLTGKLKEVGKHDPKAFWRIIEKMNHWGAEEVDPTDNISPKKWKKYFQGLLNERECSALTVEKKGATFHPTLDGVVKEEELRDAIKMLKGNKAPGPDGIYSEILKIFWGKYDQILLLLLRKFFANHIYPAIWVTNYLKPIYKKGEALDPDNFRGLAIGQALAKLYSHILLNRLNTYILNQKLISPHQIGFMKDSCTSDHIFLLQSIVEKVVKVGKKRLFAAFIDFKKAYDKVDRKILLERLQKLGINGLFLKNIQSMYEHISYSIKLKSGYLDPISSNLGLKQGCPLSPMLFNLYIDDIKDVFDESCYPVSLSDDYISHFLYADDLVLISQSSSGLQKCLDQVHNFSTDRHLTISIKKSKTLVFNPTGRLINQIFTVGAANLEPVQSFCYLGFEIKASGTVRHAIKTLHDKANKAMRPLFNAIARFNIPVKTSLRLFHTYIAPIALYNVENRLQFTDKQLETGTEEVMLNDNHEINVIHRKFLKYILGVGKSAPNLAIMGDTGETPLLFKGYRLMLNYWHRLHKLPNENLAKKALTENVKMRTNWIRTIEKLFNLFQVAYDENTNKFRATTKKMIDLKFSQKWENNFRTDHPRLEFYKRLKDTFGYEAYLDLRNYESRRSISKLRFSTHTLEIETGRHSNRHRHERLCSLCDLNEVETEEHFLIKCNTYSMLRNIYNFEEILTGKDLMINTAPNLLGLFITEAFKFRKLALDMKNNIRSST